MQRHIGKIKNTDQRCVVVFMQVPGRDDHALVCSIDGLNSRMEQALMEIVESREAQAEINLGNVLGRRLLPDTGETVISSLHNRGLLRAVPIDNVVMLPKPNFPWPLRQIIEDNGGKISGPAPVVEEKFNPHFSNAQALDVETKNQIARNLLLEADLLERDVIAKREKAYAYAPQMRVEAKGHNLQNLGMSQGAVSIEALESAPVKPKAVRKPRATTPKKPKAVKETGV